MKASVVQCVKLWYRNQELINDTNGRIEYLGDGRRKRSIDPSARLATLNYPRKSSTGHDGETCLSSQVIQGLKEGANTVRQWMVPPVQPERCHFLHPGPLFVGTTATTLVVCPVSTVAALPEVETERFRSHFACVVQGGVSCSAASQDVHARDSTQAPMIG